MRSIFAKVAVSLVGLFVVGLCALIVWSGIWLHKIESFPTPVIPNPKMPAHNAFDMFRSAGAKIVGERAIEDEAGGVKVMTLAEKRTLVESNSASLAEVVEGFSEPYCSPALRSFEQKMPYLRRFRDLARLFGLRAQVEEADGQWQQAAQSSLDAMQMGEMIPHGSELIGDLVGDACESVGRRSLWQSISHLSVGEARADVARLLAIQHGEVSFSEVLQQEEWTGQAGLIELGRKERLRSNPVASVFLRAGQYHYAQYMDSLVRNARLSYAARPAPPAEPRDLFVAMAAPVYPQAAVKYSENEAEDDFALVALALHAYKLDHGSSPDSMNQLTPAYLPSVPSDPFALDAPLHYRRAGSSYVLYSVGPDGVDDGGKPITNVYNYYSARLKKTIAGKPNHYIEPDSKGDIVAGVNL